MCEGGGCLTWLFSRCDAALGGAALHRRERMAGRESSRKVWILWGGGWGRWAGRGMDADGRRGDLHEYWERYSHWFTTCGV